MSTGLLEQLSVYYEHDVASQEPITDAEVRTLVETPAYPVQPVKRLRRRGVWVAVAAAVVTLLIIGLIPLLMGEETPPADSVVPTTLADLVTPTTAPAESAEDPIRIGNVFTKVDFVEVEPVVGSFSWTQVEGDPETLPQLWAFTTWNCCEMEVDPDGGYRVTAMGSDSGEGGWRLWRSPDGITWTHEPTVNPVSTGEWDYGPDPLTIIHNRGGDRNVVSLEAPELPPIEGLDLDILTSAPEEASAGVVVLNGELVGAFPWAEIYGNFEICEPAGCFDAAPFVWFGEVWLDNERLVQDNTAWVTDPEKGELIAVLDVEFSSDLIRFTDRDTGQVVHEIISESPELMETVRSQFKVGEDLRRLSITRYSWSGSETTPFVLTDPIPGDLYGLISLPDGGMANFFGIRSTEDGTFGDVYVSTDGRSWEVVVPDFMVNRSISEVFVRNEGDLLAAAVRYRSGGQERWVSTDGIIWTYHFQYPAGSILHQNEWGWIAMGDVSQWVSIDNGASWAQLPEAPGIALSSVFPIGGSQASGVTTGDTIWFRHDHGPDNDGNIRRLLWIGQFD